MKNIIWVLISALLMAFSLAFQVPGRPVVEAASQQPGNGESVQDLKSRIEKLEKQISAMQKRIDEMEARQPNVLPGFSSPGNQMPPGSRPFNFNGMQFWYVPITSGGK